MSTQSKTNNWYRDLVSRVNTLSETFGLDDLQTSDLRNFVMTIAKDQFKVGSKSGAAWAFKQGKEGSMQRPQVGATA
jgi:hypothetical protein